MIDVFLINLGFLDKMQVIKNMFHLDPLSLGFHLPIILARTQIFTKVESWAFKFCLKPFYWHFFKWSKCSNFLSKKLKSYP